MITLAIDTSTQYVGVGLSVGNEIVGEQCWRSNRNHGSELLPVASHILKLSHLAMRDVTHLAVAKGPGGFSSLRVGLGTVKGLALPRSLPVAGVSTLELEAAPFTNLLDKLYAVLPAGRGEVAWALYSQGNLQETGLDSPLTLLDKAPKGSHFCGEAAETIAEINGGKLIVGGPPPTRRPGWLLRLAFERFARGESDSLDELEPIYARAPSISKPRSPH